MSVNRYLRTEATLLTTKTVEGPPREDDMGDPLPGDVSVVTIETPTRCRLVHERTIETRDGGVIAVETMRVFLPASLPLPGTDARLRVREQVYTFDGPAHAVESPRTGRAAFIEATVRAVS